MRFRKAYAICSAMMIMAGSVSACSTQFDEQDAPPPPAVEVPDIPSLSTDDMKDITVDSDVAEKLSKAGSDIQDSWFLDTVNKVDGKKLSDYVLLKMRGEVCRSLSESWTLGNITSQIFTGYDLTDSQIGTIIASSMVSHCPREKLPVKTQDMPSQ